MTATTTSGRAGREPEVRDRIFASALRSFSRNGYAATSLREISADAQTTKPMIYYYFGSKEGLYVSIVRQILEEMAEAIRLYVPAGAPPGEQVIAYAERYLDHFLTHEDIIALVLREVFGLGGAPMAALGQVLADQVRHPLDQILRHGIQSGAFPTGEVSSCATAITGILNMFILAHVFGGAPIDRQTPIEQVQHYVRGLSRE